MLTVKLMKAIQHEPPAGTPVNAPPVTVFSTKIVEAEQVDIHYLRNGALVEIAVHEPVPAAKGAPSGMAFYLADRDKPRPEGFADEVDFYYAAYVENAHGATTQVVKF